MEITTSWKEEGRQMGLQQGLQQAQKREKKLILRLLKKKFGKLSKIKENQIFALPIEKAEELAESLFDFKDETEVENWLKRFAK